MDGKDGGQGQTAAEAAVALNARDQYRTYMKNFRPFERKFMDDVLKPTASREAKVTGMANADLAQQSAIPVTDPNRIAKNPMAFNNKVGGRAIVNARQAVKDRRIQGMQAITDMGMGKESSARLGFSSLAEDAVKSATVDAQSDVALNNTIAGSAMGAIGGGAAIYSNWNKPTTEEAANIALARRAAGGYK